MTFRSLSLTLFCQAFSPGYIFPCDSLLSTEGKTRYIHWRHHTELMMFNIGKLSKDYVVSNGTPQCPSQMSSQNAEARLICS